MAAGFQLGFSYASLVDPLSGARNNMLAAFYGMIALFMFLAIDAHHEMLRALASSYEELPIGVGALGADLGVLVARVLGYIRVVDDLADLGPNEFRRRVVRRLVGDEIAKRSAEA